MKFEEILPQLREGRRFKRSCWDDDIYITYTENILCSNKEGILLQYSLLDEEIFCDDWQLHRFENSTTLRKFELNEIFLGEEPENRIRFGDSIDPIEIAFGHTLSLFCLSRKDVSQYQKISKWKLILEELPNE